VDATQKVAVFVDLENIPAAFIEPAADLGDTFGRVCHLAVYADWRSGHRAAWSTTLDLGGVPRQIMKAGGPNSADISIVVDAMELLFVVPDVDVYVIASGDSDFVPLIQKLRARGKVCVGAAPVGSEVREAYEAAFDRFERLRDPGEDAAAAPVPKAKPATSAAAAAARRNGGSDLTIEKTRKALVGILAREGPTHMGELGTHLRDALPGFDQRLLGFRRLSDLLRAQSDMLSIVADGGQMRVALLPGAGSAAAKVETKPADAPKAQGPTLEGAAWTLLRDHLLAALFAPDAKARATDDELALAMRAAARRLNGADLPEVPLEQIVARFPTCFARGEEGAVIPLVNLADAYRLRLGRVWEPMPRDVMRRALALLPGVLSGEEPIVIADVIVRLAEAGNGELTQAQARGIVRLLQKAEGWAPAAPDVAERARVRPRSWVLDGAAAESKLDEAALLRMGPFLPVDPFAMSAALGRTECAPPVPASAPSAPAVPAAPPSAPAVVAAAMSGGSPDR
jgi:hypothetical protein